MDDFEEFTEEEYQEALEISQEIIDGFEGLDVDLCFAILDICYETLDHAEKAWRQDQETTYDLN